MCLVPVHALGFCGNGCNCEFLHALFFFLLVSLGFFDDILIPHHSLQHPKRLYPTLHMHRIE